MKGREFLGGYIYTYIYILNEGSFYQVGACYRLSLVM